MPKISVIIPVYNTEQYLKECLDSIIGQTFKDIEIICVDDGSVDNSLNILNEYALKDSRFIIIKQENKGAGAARNYGLKKASGDYLYFLDSDDYISDELFEKAYKQITETNADICIFENNSFDDIKKDLIPCNWVKNFKNAPDKPVFNKNDIPKTLFQISNLPAFTKLYNHKFIKDNHIEFQEIKTCNDVFFHFYTISLADRITILPDELVTHRVQHSNLTKTRGEHIECILQAFNKIKDELKQAQIFDLLEDTYYKQAVSNFEYEISRLNSEELRKHWSAVLFSSIPKKYLRKRLFKKIIKKIFSIRNENVHKVITILGIEIKIRSKKLEEREKLRALRNIND